VATRTVADKGLKKDALGFVSSVVIGVASTAPGYSLAAVLTLVVAAVGVQAPAVLILAFVPMLFIAASYYYMNRADPDCGTTFSWVTRAMGPWAGWIGGWAIIVADVIVMANLAQIAGLYGFLLFGSWIVFVFAYWANPAGGEVADLLAALRERGTEHLKAALAEAERAGVAARSELVEDRPSAGLVALADRDDARMIVVGSYGEPPLKGAIIGSTAHKLLHLSERPVLVVRA
jgi:nucleotide-binding universal stress UspA family protein